jgi:hypothetical protein
LVCNEVADLKTISDIEGARKEVREWLKRYLSVNWRQADMWLKTLGPERNLGEPGRRSEIGDDKLAPVVAQALQGDPDADRFLRDKIQWFLARGKPLPPNLLAYACRIVAGECEPPKGRGRRSWTNESRDFCISMCVYRATMFGLKATRSSDSRHSGCSVVHSELNALGFFDLSEEAINKIWLKYKPRPTAKVSVGN